MKRKLFLMVLCLFYGLAATGQNKGEWTYNFDCVGCDTLLCGEREPTFYYWDTNWFDYKVEHYTQYKQDIGWHDDSRGLRFCQPEYARYCHTDSSLRVIGVAAGILIEEHRSIAGWMSPEDPYKDRRTDYFSVYEVDSLSDSMRLVATAPWTSMAPRISMVEGDAMPMFGRKPRGVPIYEVYFDSAVTVYDSFYVSVTCNNNCIRGNDRALTFYINTAVAAVCAFRGNGSGEWLYGPDPAHFRRKLHEFDVIGADAYCYHITDTNWHTFARGYNNDTLIRVPYFFIFPIIDTSENGDWQPECRAASELGTVYVNKDIAVLRWNGGGNATSWELMLTPDGSEPDTDNLILCTSDVTTVEGLDTATWYTARVRSVCDSTRKSDWSDSIRFFVPGDTTTHGTEAIETLADSYTYIMPNPAREQITVASSFVIREVEVFTLTGKLALRQEAGDMATTVDISSLPAGTYMVRIQTTKGTAFKKLVVR